MIYSIKSALLLTLLFAAYKLTIGRKTCFGVMRIVLMFIYACSLFLPLMQYLPSAHSNEISGGEIPANMIAAIAIPSEASSIVDNSVNNFSYILYIIAIIFTVGVGISVLSTIIGLLWIASYRQRSRIENVCGIRVAVSRNRSINPFTFGRTIYLSEKDYEELDPMVLAHEYCHCKKRHYLDLIIARLAACVAWWNPFSWIMLRELHALHEFQADDYVVNQGYDLKCYQYMLIKKAAGSRLQTFADSLNHSKLKKRLTMMKKPKTKGSMLAASLMFPALLAGGLLMSSDTLASILEPMRNVDINFTDSDSAKSSDKVSDFSAEPQLIYILNQDSDENQDSDVTPADIKESEPTEKELSDSEKKDTKPAIKIDGKLMPESFDLNSIYPQDIASITVFKDNVEEFPNGLIDITTNKTTSEKKEPENTSEGIKVDGYGAVMKDEAVKEKTLKTTATVYLITEVNNVKGTNVTLTICPGNNEETEIKSVQLLLNGKEYEAKFTSSFSETDGVYAQTVKAHIDKKVKHFDPDKDKLIVHTADKVLDFPLHTLK